MTARQALAQLVTALIRLSASDGGSAPRPVAEPSGLPFNEAIGWHRRRDPALKDDAWAELQQNARRRAFTVANVTQLDLVVEVQKAIDRAIAEGTTFADFKKEVGPKLLEHWQGSVKNPAARLETIFRTNVQAAYGAGRYERALEVADTRPYWRFDGVEDIRQSQICRPLNGTIRRHDDPWWQTRIPPLHFQCRSRIATLTEKQAERAGITPDDKLPAETAQEGFGQAPASRDEVLAKWAQEKVDAAPAALRREADEKASRSVGPPSRPQPRPNAEPLPSEFKPEGVPVSKALEVKGGSENDRIERVVQAVDRVHGDGALPQIPVLTTTKTDLGAGVLGKYWEGDQGVALRIELLRGDGFQEFNALHEIGHFLDSQAMGTPGRSRSTALYDERLDPLREAFRKSRAVKRLEELHEGSWVYWVPHGRKKRERFPLDRIRGDVKYLLQGEEVFARAYAQYIAVRSGDPELLGQLDKLREPYEPVYIPQQWEDDDFAPILREFDALFEVLGWLKRS